MGKRIRFMAAALACSLSMGLLLPTEAAFQDVKDSKWYAADVSAAVEYGIIEGVGEGRFDPDGTLTLAQAITMACRVFCYAADLPQPERTEGELWYAGALTFAQEQGICTEDEFGTEYNAPCSRLTMARLFARVFPQNTAQTLNQVETLPDVANTEENAGVFFLYEQGVLTGNSPVGTFEPERTITRAETAAILHRILDPDCRKQFVLQELAGGTYEPFHGLQLFQGYITFLCRSYPQSEAMFRARIAAINRAYRNHPELTFYVYYIQKDTDLNFETGTPAWISETILEALKMPNEQKGTFTLNSFQDYANAFYRTDTHWKAEGSYRAYLELLDLLDCGGEPLQPDGDLITISEDFQGNKATQNGVSTDFVEPFQVYRFSYPSMTVTLSGKAAAEYGNESAYLNGTATAPVSYGNFYGGDKGEVVLSSGKGTESLLLLGESYDNALLKLLANHYQTIYAVDLRWYEKQCKKTFDLTTYTQERGISKVLLIGNHDYFCVSTFDPE